MESERRRRSYLVGARISRARMEQDSPEDAAALEAVGDDDIIVVSGAYDKVEWVLEALGLPHHIIMPEDVATFPLAPDQLLIVNCPGRLGPDGIEAARGFVDGGGSLFTTDWALRHLIEPGFPDTIRFNRRPTRNDIVRIAIARHDNPFLRGVLDPEDDPLWWLEGSSYPIDVLDPGRVEVLITSGELETNYGADPVAVVFRHGVGEVFHTVSHYYLQRAETRTRRHGRSGAFYAAEKGIGLSSEDLALAADLQLTEVEAAASSTRWLSNVIAAKKRASEQGPSTEGGDEPPQAS